MSISDRAAQLVAARTPFVRATVVRAQQPTSARPGDEAILLADGTIEGFVGGHCAQNSVRKAAMGVLQAGESVLLRVLPDGDVHFPEAPGRVCGGQPVPGRRIPGDLPDPAAAGPADPDLRRNPDRRRVDRTVRPVGLRRAPRHRSGRHRRLANCDCDRQPRRARSRNHPHGAG